MNRKEPTMIDLLIDTHLSLERQGPGSTKSTEMALGFIKGLSETSQIADLGCGTGGEVITIAKKTKDTITGLDLFPSFIDSFTKRMIQNGLSDRVKGVVGDMTNLPFERNSFDLIWSEGAIDSIGFERGISHWRSFLKNEGYLAVTCPSWLTSEKPEVVKEFWESAGSSLNTVDENIRALVENGYRYIASFTIPDECWTENYFIPRSRSIALLSEKYEENETMKSFIEQNRYETELFSKYSMFYGYVFYIAKAIRTN